jgi:two-component system chemotaxis sensor kinase CheA
MSQANSAKSILSGLSGEILAVDQADPAGLESISASLRQGADLLRDSAVHLADLLESAERILARTLEDPEKLSESQRMLAAQAVDLVCRQIDCDPSGSDQRVDLLGSQLLASLAEGPARLNDGPGLEPRSAEPGQPGGEPAEPQQVSDDTPPPADQDGPSETDAAQRPVAETAGQTGQSSLLQEYTDAAEDHLARAENCLLHLEANPGNENHIHQALRAFHTLKGSSAMLGLMPIEHLAHLAESLLSQARSGTVEIIESRTDVALRACDMLRGLVHQAAQTPGQRLQSPEGYDELASQLSLAACPDWQQTDDQAGPIREPLPDGLDPGMLVGFCQEGADRLRQNQANLLARDPLGSEDLSELRETLHGLTQAGSALELPCLESYASALFHWVDRAIEAGEPLTGGYLDLTMEAVDQMRQCLEIYAQAARSDAVELPAKIRELTEALEDPDAAGIACQEPEESLRIGEILVGRGQVQPEQIRSALADNAGDLLGKVLLHQGAGGRDVSSALRVQRQLNSGAPRNADSTLRVSARRMDELVNLVGELLVSHSMVRENPSVQGPRRRRRRKGSASGRRARREDRPPRSPEAERLARDIDRTDSLLKDLHQLAVSLRMVPMRGLFEKARRLSRDLSRRSGKPLQLLTEGEDTEIDRNMVDMLSDPLVHLIRNAVDHGIESAAGRGEAEKDPTATLRIRAFRAGSNVVLSLEDDGKGLDLDSIREKALQTGLIDPAVPLSDAEVSSLIFHPGFTTAPSVTGVSGRGVGMDVVRRTVEALNGRIDVFSEPGKGTRFEIRLPLTTAVEDVLTVEVAQGRYLLSAADIERTLSLPASEIRSAAGGRPHLLVGEQTVPVLDLCQLLHHRPSEPTENVQLVLVRRGLRHCAVRVERVVRQSQVVIKPLGGLLARVPYFTGAAVLADGDLGLILDATYLIGKGLDRAHAA